MERARNELRLDVNTLRALVGRFSYIALGIAYITIATIAWQDFGYLNLSMLIPEWILLFIAGLALIVGSSSILSSTLEKYFILFLLPGIAAFFIVLIQRFPVFGTDEIAIDTYGAYLLLHGIDPYVNGNMANVFSFYSVPLYLITPLLKGGYVKYLVYPGLSVLVFIPAVLFHLESNLILIVFNLLSFVVLFAYYSRKGMGYLFPYAAFLLLIDINWIYYSVGGVTDIVWVVLLSLAYINRKDVLLSGAFFGLAVAFKQTPAVIFPFFLYFIYRETGRSFSKSILFAISTAVFFLLPNLPFIAMNPAAWLHNVAGVANQPVIGIGMGVSIISFADISGIAYSAFYIIPAMLLVFLFILYINNFEKMRLAYFALPVIPFLFYYRLLVNYVLYWPYLILLALPDILAASAAYQLTQKDQQSIRLRLNSLKTKKVESVMVVCLIAGAGGVTAFGIMTHQHEPFEILKIDGFSDPADLLNVITMMNVTVKYTPLNGELLYQPVYFRILVNGPIVSANGLLWSAINPVLTPGINNLTILPNTPLDFLQQGVSFRVIAYYGDYLASISSPPVTLPSKPLFVNPYLIDPVNSPANSIPPGWIFGTNDQRGNGYIYSQNQEIVLTAIRHSTETGWAASEIYSDGINLSGLAAGNYVLKYNLIFNSNSTITESNVTALGYPDVFYGVQFGFENLTKQIWIGYNSSGASQLFTPSSNLVVILTNHTTVSFAYVYSMAQRLGWNTRDCIFSYLVASWSANGTFSATFNSFELQGLS